MTFPEKKSIGIFLLNFKECIGISEGHKGAFLCYLCQKTAKPLLQSPLKHVSQWKTEACVYNSDHGTMQLVIVFTVWMEYNHTIWILNPFSLHASISVTFSLVYSSNLPLPKWRGIHLYDAVLHKSLGSDQLIVTGIVYHINDTCLACNAWNGSINKLWRSKIKYLPNGELPEA